MDGREALQHIKSDELLKIIPILIMTTSRADEDVQKTYGLGANSYITKPVTFQGMLDVIGAMKEYWFQTVRLPADE